MGIYSVKNILNEVYFGDDVLHNAQKILDEYRDNIISNGLKGYVKMASDPLLIEFNREIEKVFGFKSFCLYPIPEIGDQNAYTFPVSTDILYCKNAKNIVKKSSKGFKYDPKARVSVLVAIGSDLISNPRLSGREVMAIILHEIGHNFQMAIHNQIFSLNMISTSLSYINIIIGTVIKGDPILLSGLITKSNRLKHGISKFKDAMIEVVPGITNLFFIFGLIRSALISLPLKLLKLVNPLSVLTYVGLYLHLQSSLKYNYEVVADNFATMYGYGEDLSSAKITINYYSDRRIPDMKNLPKFLRTMFGVYDLFIAIPSLIIDPHPSVPEALRLQVQYLEDELRYQKVDPKMKKEIQQTINNINKTLDSEFYTNTINDRKYIEKRYIAKCTDREGGDPVGNLADIMGIGPSGNNMEIQKRFDEIKMI